MVRFEVLTAVLLKIHRLWQCYIVLTSQLLSEFRPIVLLFSSGSGNPTSGLVTVKMKRTLQAVTVAIYESKQPDISDETRIFAHFHVHLVSQLNHICYKVQLNKLSRCS
jgi:hypothetical protein